MSPAVFLYAKSFGGFAEYAHQHGHRQRRRGADRHQPGLGRDRIVRADGRADVGSRCPAPGALRSGRRHWGAVQVAARYAEISLDRDLFTSGGAAANTSRKAQQMTFDTNWFLNNYVKIYTTYERGFRSRAVRAPTKTSFCSGCSSHSEPRITRITLTRRINH